MYGNYPHMPLKTVPMSVGDVYDGSENILGGIVLKASPKKHHVQKFQCLTRIFLCMYSIYMALHHGVRVIL